MAMVLDHTIVPVRNREKSVEFYSRISRGLKTWAKWAHFWRCGSMTLLTWISRCPTTIGASTTPLLMESAEFEAAFLRIQESGISYGDSPYTRDNMQGPGMTMGAKGLGKAVYFDDPDGHILEIKTY